jgi:putative hydrolase of HD superfamily
MGYAVADVARRRGHEVVLVSGPVALPAPDGVLIAKVTSAEDMLKAVKHHFTTSDVLIMAAAVADWRPVSCRGQKIKKLKTDGDLRLEPTPDILATLRPLKGDRIVVGFAAETENLLSEAKRKCESKGLDLIVANDVGRKDAGFDVDTNQVVFLLPDGQSESLPLMSKQAVAGRIIDWVESRQGSGTHSVGHRRDITIARENGGERLAQIMEFIREVDKLKHVYRKTLLMDGSRYENDAEHSWHLALMAVLLAEYANVPGLNVSRVMEMVLVHDLVEIDAGDTYCYDDAGNLSKAARERVAADRVFGLLPADIGSRVRGLWEEFEARITPEAKFAAALDRVQPLMHNYFTGGVVWRNHGVGCEKVRDRNHHVVDGSVVLWEYAESLIRQAVDDSLLARE